MMLKKVVIAAAIVIAAVLGFSCESRNSALKASPEERPVKKFNVLDRKRDAAFMAEAANEVMLEIQLSELAVKRASSPEVMELAVTIITDQRIAEREMQDIAVRNNLQLSGDLSEANRDHFNSMAGKEGRSFDKAFCLFLSANNKVTLKKFESIVQNGNSEEIKDWAWRKVPVLKRHLSLASELGGGSGTTNPSDHASIIE